MLSILYYFPEKNSFMYEWQRFHIFDELERHGITIHAFNPLTCRSWAEANELIIEEAKKGCYDLFMTCICNENILYVDTLHEIKRLGIPSLSFRPDNLIIPYNDKMLAPYFDLVWLTAKETQYLYDRWGVRTMFAPYAANPNFFTYHEEPLIKKVCFIGNPYGSRAKMMNALTDNQIKTDLFHGGNIKNKAFKDTLDLKLSTNSKGRLLTLYDSMKFKEGRKLLHGLFVNKIKHGENLHQNEYLTIQSSVPFDQISGLYSKYVLSLASTSTNHTDVLKSPLNVANLRNFEIPMAGGIELCRYSEEMADYFEDGKEIIFYHSDEEMVDKATYYIMKASDKEIYKIKLSARIKAEGEHTWYHRFFKAFECLGLHRL